MKQQYLQSLTNEWNLNKESPMNKAPLYHQLYSILKSSILDGTMGYETQMPTEQELESAFSLSLIHI